MTPDEKLRALVERAGSNGWLDANTALNELKGMPEWSVSNQTPFVVAVIFNHDFARALFGEDIVQSTTRLEEYRRYELVLMQAVISDNPIDYMYSVIFDV